MLKPLRTISLGLALVVTACIAATAPATTPAAAAIPPPATKLVWKNLHSRLCLGAAAGNTVRGTAVIQWTCNNSQDQTWVVDTFLGARPGQFVVKNSKKSSMCLSVAADSLESGASLVLWDCKSSVKNMDQRWMFLDSDLAACTIFINANSLKVMSVRPSLNPLGAQVVQATFQDQNHQHWCSEPGF